MEPFVGHTPVRDAGNVQLLHCTPWKANTEDGGFINWAYSGWGVNSNGGTVRFN